MGQSVVTPTPRSNPECNLAPRFIRLNAIHPTNLTHLLHNAEMYKVFRPDLEQPTREDAELALTHFQAKVISYIEPEVVANLAAFLASDEPQPGPEVSARAGGAHLARLALGGHRQGPTGPNQSPTDKSEGP
jgi:NAD(P)-dependent dehydrogenase (short-subunit alcohol dehydrogenase family)